MPERKKVLYVVTKSVWGGAQRYVYDLATKLPKNRFDVVVASGGAGPLFDMLARAGIRAIPIRALERDINVARELAAFFQLIKIYIRERPDIIHLSSSKAGGLGALAAFIYKCYACRWSLITIFTVHGWGFLEDRAPFTRKMILLASWSSSLFQDNIILLDRADFGAAEKFIPRSKLVLIPNGIGDIDFIARADARAMLTRKIGHPIPQETILAGTIAELTRNKGLHYLIEAIKALALSPQPSRLNLCLVIIGDGEDKDILQKEINSYGLGEVVFLTGFIPHAHQYLKALDIFVLPSLKEGLPYAMLEAMAAGVAIIATRTGGIPDLIENRKQGLIVRPKDAPALAEALKEFMASETFRQYLAQSATGKQATDFSIRVMLEKTEALYDRPL